MQKTKLEPNHQSALHSELAGGVGGCPPKKENKRNGGCWGVSPQKGFDSMLGAEDRTLPLSSDMLINFIFLNVSKISK